MLLSRLEAFAAAMLVCSPAPAWILPEHAQITAEAAAELKTAEQEVLRELWTTTRIGSPERLCEGLGRARVEGGEQVRCLGFADLPSVAGDHSCTPEELLREVTTDDWLRDVVEVGNATERRLRDAKSDSARINAWSRSNLLLERVDGEYAARATSNQGHFVLTARPGQALDEYLALATKSDAPLNATGLYVVFHLTALRYAVAYAEDPTRREHWARLAVFSEAFALHFLQDSFSSGHTVGTWGGPAVMKGTHDEYSVHGLPSRSWSGEAYSPHGDAHMTPMDLRRTRRAVATSLSELVRAVTSATSKSTIVASWSAENANFVWRLDTCARTELGFTVPPRTVLSFTRPVWVQTIMPMPGESDAHMPRFRAEIGPFFALGAGTDAAANWGGYFTDASAAVRGSANVFVFAGVGVGLEGAIGISNDGLIQLGIGRNFASRQYEPGCDDCGAGEADESIPARVPTRSALLLHYRAPYWLVPGDLLVAAPILLAADFRTYKNMAVMSANGGLLGLQQVFLTPMGTFQFILGRELNVLLFDQDDQVLSFDGGDPENASSYSLFEVNSVKFDAPVLSYQPLRSFSDVLTAAVALQLGAAIDVPTGTNVRTRERVSPGLSYSMYLRLVMGTRWYLGTSAP